MLGGGGYVAGPVGLAARTLRLPLVLTEADSHLGVSNRMLAPFARARVPGLPDRGPATARSGSSPGGPCRAGTEGGRPRRGARAPRASRPDGPCLLVFGGSLGARRLNDAALEAFGAAAPCAVLHAAGRRDYDGLRARLAELGSPPHYRLLPYVEPFADALAAADLAVARAGGSVFELAAAGLPVDPRALSARHRRPPDRERALHGARRRGGRGPDAELTGRACAREVGGLLAAPQRLAEMAKRRPRARGEARTRRERVARASCCGT